MENLEKLYTIKEVVDLKMLGYGVKSVRNFIKDGKLEAIITNNGQKKSYRISEKALDTFKKQNYKKAR